MVTTFLYVWLKNRKRDMAFEMGRPKHTIISKSILIIVAKGAVFVAYVRLNNI